MRLQHLVAEAVALGGGNLCAAGHAWESEGGRCCPHELTDHCSQAVYRCARCGIYDYGEDNGPGEADCRWFCEHGHRQRVATREDAQ